MSNIKHSKLKFDEIPSSAGSFEVDLSHMFESDKELKSIKVIWNGLEYWLAEHYQTGRYWTTNVRDPKILNTTKNPPRPRGNVNWNHGGGNPSGRTKGARNKVSVKQACDRMGCNPAEFLAALVMGNTGELKRHRIKNPHEVTIAQKMKAAEVLLNKMVPNLKPVDLDAEGEPVVLDSSGETERTQIQVYIPSSGKKLNIDATKSEVEELQAGNVADFMKNHEKETTHYDSENEEESMVWKFDPESDQ